MSRAVLRLAVRCLVLGLALGPGLDLGLSAFAQVPAVAQGVVGACRESSEAAPERVIADCDAALADKATAEEATAGLYRARAEARIRKGELQAAIDDLGQAIGRKADDARSLLTRAELRRQTGDSDGAIADFTSALRREPADVAALFARGELYRTKGDRRSALADFVRVLRLEPAHAAANVHRKELALEIEKLGAMMPVENRPRR